MCALGGWTQLLVGSGFYVAGVALEKTSGNRTKDLLSTSQTIGR